MAELNGDDDDDDFGDKPLLAGKGKDAVETVVTTNDAESSVVSSSGTSGTTSTVEKDEKVVGEEKEKKKAWGSMFTFGFFKDTTLKQDWDQFVSNRASRVFGIGCLMLGVVIVGVVSILVHFSHKPKHELPPLINVPKYGKLKYLRGLIDPDTPEKFYKRMDMDGKEWQLAFSDEFNAVNRTFYDGDDQFFQAIDFHYGSTDDLEYYSPDMVTTHKGALRITMDDFKTKDLNFTSGMVQSWNRLCFSQGYMELSVRMPGHHKSRGLWPAIWTLGNLARPGFSATTDGVWPYSYDACDVGVTPNQSSSDGLSFLPGQRLSSCVCSHQDHPSPGKARGAPEIDVLEGLL
ncbi:unnamed protein product [Ambrosiozyma monospora]|uniref:Unnamed protein product n=1 Tax=Ambrosiozyma monospora TaxID=43982 RepID=A0ACB5TY54_AMBMO|nr:unnamed protein product [Ambrosiozyma monospora]